MKRNDLNENMCEKLFGGELKVTVEPDYSRISDARQKRDCKDRWNASLELRQCWKT